MSLWGVATYHFQFWDAQIWASARFNQIKEVYSEDFSSGATIQGDDIGRLETVL